MTEFNDHDSNVVNNPATLASTLEKLSTSFEGLNATMEQIRRDNDKRTEDKPMKLFQFMAIAIVLIVIALAGHMFYVIQAMEKIMSTMSHDMGEMRKHTLQMTASMENMTQYMQTMTTKVSTMSNDMEKISGNMQNMSTNMQQVSGELHLMSSNMEQISSDMRDMRQATILMETNTRTMSRKLNEMSSTVSPVMEGARKFMPFMPNSPWNHYSRR
jgi:uncharacterized protein YoxC